MQMTKYFTCLPILSQSQSGLSNVCRWCPKNRLYISIHMLVLSNKETCHSDDPRIEIFMNNVGLGNKAITI